MKSLASYLSFTGQAGCYAELPLEVLAGATTFTIEAKFSTASTKRESDAWKWGTIAGREISFFGKDDFGFCVNDGKLCFWCSPASKGTANSNTQKVMSSTIVNDGAIHKVAVVSSNGAIDLYCDGVNVAHTDNVNAKITDAQTILLAYDSDSNSYLQMDLYEARFWNVARSAEEIFADITGTETGLQGWYLPTADGLKDYSGNDRHATLYGSPAYTKPTLKAWLPFDESATLDRCVNSWTATGDVSLSTDINLFGAASIHLPNGAYLTANNVIDINADKWTFDAWAYLVSSSGDNGYFALSARTDAARYGIINGNDGIYVAATGSGWQAKNTSTTFPSVKSQWVHLAVVKNGTRVTFYQNGTAVWSCTTSALDNSGAFILGGNYYGYDTDIYFDEVRFYEGVALWTTDFTPPTSADYAELSLALGYPATLTKTFDVERKLSNVVEFTADVERKVIAAWRYFNAGTADTLTVTGTTLTDLPETKAVTGTAFYQTAREKCFDLPTTPEIWIKFDVYFDGSNRWRAYNSGSAGNCGLFPYDVDSLRFWANSTTSTDFAGIIKTNQLQTVILHMVSGTSAGVIEAWVGGTKIHTYTGDVNHGEDFADIYLQSDGAGTFFSNVIISNKRLTFADGYQKFTADVERRTSQQFEFIADVERKVNNVISTEFFADVEILDVLPVEFAADVERRLNVRVDFDSDVEILDVIPVEFTADINRAIKGKVKLFAIDNSKYFSGDGDSGTLNPAVIPSQETIPAAPDNTIGLQSIEISLSEQQLTDNVSFVGVVPFDIMFPVQGQYLDYVFDMRVERVQQKGVLYTCDCCVDVDQLLYTQVAYIIPENTEFPSDKEDDDDNADDSSSTDSDEEIQYPLASMHAWCIAALLGKFPIMQFDDFLSTVLTANLGGATYADLIRDVFGWSSRVPTHMINVFIRNDKIYFVQRGHEAHLLDLTGTKHTIPIVTHELVRMTWGSTPWSQTETREVNQYETTNLTDGDNTDDPDDPDDDTRWTNVGEVVTEDKNGRTVTTYHYTLKGILRKTTAVFESYVDNKENNTKTTINYYDIDGLISGTQTTIRFPHDYQSNSEVVTTYGYVVLIDGKKFLSTEMTSEYDYKGSLINQRTTTKSPTGGGQGTSDDDSGGASGSGNKGDDRTTPYQREQTSSTAQAFKDAANQNLKAEKESRTLNGLSLYDSSFPIHNVNKLMELTEAIRWLNRRTKETVTMTIYEYPHLIDFNDRILFNGAEYFLVSNVAMTNARVFNEQRVTFVRWY